MPVDIAFVLTGDFHRNARALKQVRALAADGYSVRVVGLEGDAPAAALPPGVDVRLIERPEGSGPAWFLNVHRAFSAALSGADARCFHASDLYALASCSSRARVSGARLTYDARELYTAVASVQNRPLARAFWGWLERRHIRRADAVFTVSGTIADELARRYGIERPLLVPNVPDAASRRPGPGLRSILRAADVEIGDKEPIVLHLGQMRADRGCDVLIEAFGRETPGRLVFLGYGPEEARLRRMAEGSAASERIHFLPPVDPDRVHAAARDASVGVTLLQDSCLNHRYALPNKLFDYIHAGVPVLAARLPEIRRVVEGGGIGLTVDPGDPLQVAETMRGMLVDENRRAAWIEAAGRAAETFSWHAASERLTTRFHALLDDR
jgi:glycosyltransferase involved in cell wall biosynthesis